MLKARILSALVMIPLVLAAYLAGQWWFTGLLAVLGALMGWEWSRLCRSGFDRVGLALSGALGLSAVLAHLNPWVDLVWLIVCGVAFWHHATPEGRSRWWMGGGVVYLGLPLWAVVWLRDSHAGVLLWLLLLVWGTDIGAYFAGRTIGGPKLLPAVSPKKTWAGLIGGMSLAAIVGGCLAAPGQVLTVAAVSAGLAVLAQAGDLFESWVKRHFDVKDSSAIIPGHGGVLDRLDGFLSTAPVLAGIIVVYGLAEQWVVGR